MRCLVFVVAACASSPTPPPTAPPAAQAILDELNRWCHAQGDDCDAAMRREAYPGRVPAGETNGWIGSHRERLAQLGLTVVWEAGEFRFATAVE